MNTPPRTDSFPNAIEDSLKSLTKKAMAAVTAPLTPPQDPSEPHHEPPKFLIGGDDPHGIDTVPEEEEEEDRECEHDTGSSIAEPVTPPSVDHIGPGSSKPSSSSALHSLAKPAAITVQAATPPQQASMKTSPQNSQVNLKRSSSKLSSFFRRSGSHMTLHLNAVSPADITKDPHQTPTSPKLKSRHSFFHITSTTNNTPQGSAANTPPAEVSPSQTLQAETEDLTLKKPATNTIPPTGPRYRLNRNRRASSMTGIPQVARAQSEEDLDKLGVGSIPDFTRPAPMGVGLKSRRLSHAVPQIDIDIVPLSSKYSSASHVPLKHKKIGSGATAVVKLFKKINCPTSEIYAVKEYRHQSRSESEQEFKDKVSSEYTLSHSLHHPNIVETVDLCMGTAHRWCAVMEYCGGGDLYSIIEAGFMSDVDKLCVFKQMMRGVAYLHNHGIAHRDLKPENLIMREDGYLKITDFGSAEVFSGEHPGVAGVECGVGMTDEIRLSKPGICGSEPYLSPEVLARKEAFDPRKLDVWASAVVTQVLFVKGLPWLKASSSDSKYAQYETAWSKWTAKNPDQIISDDNYPSSTKFLSLIETKALRRMLFKMMHLDPAKRITAQQVLEDRWVKGLECCALDHVDDHAPGMVDCSKKSSCKTSAKLGVKRMHAHIPPKINSASSFFAAHKNGINI